ncbi:MAG: methyltransferase domain-containing protein [Smithella sp.]
MGLDQENSDFSIGPLKTSHGQYFFSREKKLILELLAPRSGERMLCIGDDVGDYLQIFRDKWCQLTGLVPSVEMLKSLRKQVGEGIDLYSGNAEDLPFSDDEFDVVFVIKALEAARNPEKIIAEATRVCCGRVFIGFLNKYSFAGTHQKLKRIFGFPITEKIRFFGIKEIKEMAKGLIDIQTIKWGSVIYFPAIIYDISTEIEELLPHMNNPLGAFMGITFPVKYIYRAVQNPLVESYQLKTDVRTAPETVRGMLQKNDR